jgi:hypothetical protein
MTGFKIPKGVAQDGLKGRTDFEWADGTYVGTVEIVRIREVSVNDDAGPKFVLKPGESTAEVSSIQIGDIAPVDEGIPGPGKQKYFDDLILLSVDGLSFFGDLPEGCNGRLKYAQYHLGNLAHAMGLTEDVGEDVAPVANFEELYRQTTNEGGKEYGLAGARVMFRLETQTFKKRDGTDGKRTELKQYIQAI